MVYEGFNRPRAIRFIESIFHPLLCKTVGPMQTFSNTKISEFDSIQLGIDKINKSFMNAMLEGSEKAKEISGVQFDPITNRSHRSYLVRCVASDYNKDDSYVDNIESLNNEIIEMFYKSLLKDEVVYNWRYTLLS